MIASGSKGCPLQGSIRAAAGKDFGRQVDVVPKEAGIAGLAEEAQVPADVMRAGQAEFTVVAIDGGLKQHFVAGRPPCNAHAGLDHFPGGFMPENHRIVGGHVAHRSFGKIMQVRAASADVKNPHLHFSRALDRRLADRRVGTGVERRVELHAWIRCRGARPNTRARLLIEQIIKCCPGILGRPGRYRFGAYGEVVTLVESRATVTLVSNRGQSFACP